MVKYFRFMNEDNKDPNIGQPFYINANYLTDIERRDRDRWCLQQFGDYRHDTETDFGWLLRNEAEYIWFISKWGINR